MIFPRSFPKNPLELGLIRVMLNVNEVSDFHPTTEYLRDRRSPAGFQRIEPENRRQSGTRPERGRPGRCDVIPSAT
jgi:hypothetical protein